MGAMAAFALIQIKSRQSGASSFASYDVNRVRVATG